MSNPELLLVCIEIGQFGDDWMTVLRFFLNYISVDSRCSQAHDSPTEDSPHCTCSKDSRENPQAETLKLSFACCHHLNVKKYLAYVHSK